MDYKTFLQEQISYINSKYGKNIYNKNNIYTSGVLLGDFYDFLVKELNTLNFIPVDDKVDK